jgi:formylmethanofuran dehydrogenase subunit D
MSMLTLNGMVLNVFDTPASTDKKTGEVRAASTRVQIQAENTLENGQKRFDMVTLKVQDGEVYKKLVGKPVRVPVGAFIANGAILYYALRETPQNAA